MCRQSSPGANLLWLFIGTACFGASIWVVLFTINIYNNETDYIRSNCILLNYNHSIATWIIPIPYDQVQCINSTTFTYSIREVDQPPAHKACWFRPCYIINIRDTQPEHRIGSWINLILVIILAIVTFVFGTMFPFLNMLETAIQMYGCSYQCISNRIRTCLTYVCDRCRYRN